MDNPLDPARLEQLVQQAGEMRNPAAQPIEHTLHGSGFGTDTWQAPTGVRCVRLLVSHPSGHVYILPLGVVQADELARQLTRQVDLIRKGWENGSSE